MNVNKAIRVIATTLGMIVGLARIEHGILEGFQGNIRPERYLVDAIGPE